MREATLLNALAQAKGGIQINLSRKGATVATRYVPLVRYSDLTIMAAALEVARVVLHDRRCPPTVKAALVAYDANSEYVQL